MIDRFVILFLLRDRRFGFLFLKFIKGYLKSFFIIIMVCIGLLRNLVWYIIVYVFVEIS